MQTLLDTFLEARHAVLVKELYLDGTAREQQLLRASIAEIAQDSPAILAAGGTDWVLCTLCRADKPIDETFRVFQGVIHGLVQEGWRFSGLLSLDPQGNHVNCNVSQLAKVADDCLIALSFFAEQLAQKTKRTGAPSPQYYEKLGKFAFNATGFDTVADDWDFWVEFLGSELPVTTLSTS